MPKVTRQVSQVLTEKNRTGESLSDGDARIGSEDARISSARELVSTRG